MTMELWLWSVGMVAAGFMAGMATGIVLTARRKSSTSRQIEQDEGGWYE